MKNRNSVITVLVCALILVGVLFFVMSSFIPGVCCGDHDCAGKRCVICLCASIQKNLSRIIVVAACVLAILAPAVLSVCFISESRDSFIKEQTPVYLKVKLSN